MGKNSKKASVFGLATALTVLTGCSGSAHDPTEKYVLIAASTKVQYWQAAYAGLRRAAGELGVKAEMEGPDGHDSKAESEAFQHAVAGKPAGIMVSVADAALLTPDIHAAIAKGIPVITIDSDAPESESLLFVGTDNYSAGMAGGKLTATLLSGKGNVVVYRLPDQPNQVKRLSGYQSAFATHPAIKITQTVDLQDQPDRAGFAYDNAKKMLDSKAQVDAFVCLESRSCSGVADAVNRNNLAKKVAIIAMDTDPETIDWMSKGVISATIAQRPFTMAYYGAKRLDDLFHHPPTPLVKNWRDSQTALLPEFIDTGSFIVDSKNLAAFKEQTKSSDK